MSRGLTWLFAIAGGAAVGNLYWAQPLLDIVGSDLRIEPSTAGLLVTVTQIGYAVGVFLIVPLGDTVRRHRLIPALAALAALALLGAALAPTFPVLLGALMVVGLATVSGQLLTPLAGDLAGDDQRGRVVGTVASGLMLGLLVSRAVSGLVADLVGWRAVFILAAALSVIVAALLARFLPRAERRARVPYGRLLISVLGAVRQHSAVRVMLLLGGSVMAVFTIFWTGLTFLLSSAPFDFSVAQIGLVSLVGIAGAIAAQRVGRLYDRGLAVAALGVGLILTLTAIVLAGAGGSSIIAIMIAVALLSIGIQSSQVLLQTSMLSIDPGARSRLNTVFIVGNFTGGAIGSALAGALWSVGAWTALMLAAAALTGFALVVWLAQRRRALAPGGGR